MIAANATAIAEASENVETIFEFVEHVKVTVDALEIVVDA